MEELLALRNEEDPAGRPEVPLAALAAPPQLSPSQEATGGLRTQPATIASTTASATAGAAELEQIGD